MHTPPNILSVQFFHASSVTWTPPTFRLSLPIHQDAPPPPLIPTHPQTHGAADMCPSWGDVPVHSCIPCHEDSRQPRPRGHCASSSASVSEHPVMAPSCPCRPPSPAAEEDLESPGGQGAATEAGEPSAMEEGAVENTKEKEMGSPAEEPAEQSENQDGSTQDRAPGTPPSSPLAARVSQEDMLASTAGCSPVACAEDVSQGDPPEATEAAVGGSGQDETAEGGSGTPGNEAECAPVSTSAVEGEGAASEGALQDTEAGLAVAEDQKAGQDPQDTVGDDDGPVPSPPAVADAKEEAEEAQEVAEEAQEVADQAALEEDRSKQEQPTREVEGRSEDKEEQAEDVAQQGLRGRRKQNAPRRSLEDTSPEPKPSTQRKRPLAEEADDASLNSREAAGRERSATPSSLAGEGADRSSSHRSVPGAVKSDMEDGDTESVNRRQQGNGHRPTESAGPGDPLVRSARVAGKLPSAKRARKQSASEVRGILTVAVPWRIPACCLYVCVRVCLGQKVSDRRKGRTGREKELWVETMTRAGTKGESIAEQTGREGGTDGRRMGGRQTGT